MAIIRTCTKHGTHSNWRVSRPPSYRRKNKGIKYECRHCHGEKEKTRRRRRIRKKNYDLVLKYAGVGAAEEYRNTPGIPVSQYVYRGRNFYLPQSMFKDVNSRQTKKRLLRVGEKRIISFLEAPTCERCGHTHANPSFFEVHHIEHRANGGNNDPSNLIILCPNCHTESHLAKKKLKNPFSSIKI